MYHLGKTLCRYVFQICNIFHNLDSFFYPIWTSCKVLFQKQMGQIWDIVFTSSCTIEKLAIIWLIFPIIWWLYSKEIIVFFLSFSYFVTHKNTTHTTTFTVCNDEPIRKQLKTFPLCCHNFHNAQSCSNFFIETNDY